MSLHIGAVLTVLLLAASTTTGSAAPYKGRGGQIEAYGTVTGTFIFVQRALEECGKFPALKNESERIGKKYNAENKPVFDQLNQHIQELAEKNGGEVERRRLKAELESAMPELNKDIARELGKTAANETACSELISNIQRGDWDLKIRAARKIDVIMDASDQSRPTSLLNGVLDGCIDGQKRQLSQQGLQYQGNEELVRQYCHCMAPLTMDIVSTADGRAKLMEGDAKIKARVQKNEAACLDGLKNGRKFAP